MVYFFKREGSVIQCEIRVDFHGHGFELVIDAPEAACVERFQEPAALNARWTELEGRLLSEGWSEPSYPRRGAPTRADRSAADRCSAFPGSDSFDGRCELDFVDPETAAWPDVATAAWVLRRRSDAR